jgi:hypothetical protein
MKKFVAGLVFVKIAFLSLLIFFRLSNRAAFDIGINADSDTG